jgi:environmental stress-induced protein Ves
MTVSLAAAQRLDLRTLPPQRWKNGAGTTREIAVEPAGAGTDDFDWRLSLAEVDRDAPFSAFPGVDRCIVLLRGSHAARHPRNIGRFRPCSRAVRMASS